MIQRVLAIIMILIGCFAAQAQRPERLPDHDRVTPPWPPLVILSEEGSYCVRDGGDLLVTIRNSGLSPISDGYVHVTFSPNNNRRVTREVGRLPRGRMRTIRIPVPADCGAQPGQNCYFDIRVTNRAVIRRDQRVYASVSSLCLG